MTDASGALQRVRAAGYAAFHARDPDVEVLDLLFDSLVDTETGPTDDVRCLLFTGADCFVQLRAHGTDPVTATLDVEPERHKPVEVATYGGGEAVRRPCRPGPVVVRPGLTTFFLGSPDSPPRIRTPWISL